MVVMAQCIMADMARGIMVAMEGMVHTEGTGITAGTDTMVDSTGNTVSLIMYNQ